MQYEGFNRQDFEVFSIPGLENRMSAIRERIQPKFQTLGKRLTDELAFSLGQEMFLHIAKHARRTVNPPKDTWLAIAGNKRGYKKHPHFQLGLFDDHLFLWLAFIYELPNKGEIAGRLIQNVDKLQELIPKDFVISTNHMEKEATPVRELDLLDVLRQFQKVKQRELLIGRQIPRENPIVQDGDQLIAVALDTFQSLVPVYQLALSSDVAPISI